MRNIGKRILIAAVVIMLLPIWNVHVKGGEIEEHTSSSGAFYVTGSSYLLPDSVITYQNGAPRLYNLFGVLLRVSQDATREEYEKTKRISLCVWHEKY